jgi:deazaflavin-dependent oxidoreductase (nitroreductase family)
VPDKQHGFLRQFNRAVVNPITKLFAGKFFYALIYHIGRHSGKAYATPIVAVKKGLYIYSPLPYGTDTDWYLNIKAADKCEIKINRKLYSAATPEIIDESIALSNFPSRLGWALKRATIKSYLRINIV